MTPNPNTEEQKLTTANIIIGVIVIAIAAVIVFLLLDGKNVSVVNQENSANKEEQALKEANQDALNQENIVQSVELINENDHILGEIGAPVEFIVYSDFECPFCANFSETIKQVKEEFGDKIVIAFRHFPLFTIHPSALSAALASECAAEQGKFWEMHDKLFEDSRLGVLNNQEFKNDAVELGLDAATFNQCLDTEKYKDKVMAQRLSGMNAGITGTPGNFINKEPLPGAYPLEDFTDSAGNQRQGLRSVINRHLNK